MSTEINDLKQQIALIQRELATEMKDERSSEEAIADKKEEIRNLQQALSPLLKAEKMQVRKEKIWCHEPNPVQQDLIVVDPRLVPLLLPGTLVVTGESGQLFVPMYKK